MLYDNGPLPSGNTPRTPTHQTPGYTPTPRTPMQMPAYAPGSHNSPEQRALYKAMKKRTPSMQRGTMPPPPVGAPPMTPYPQPQRSPYKFGFAGGVAGGQAPAIGYRPINPNQMRDAAGNMPGDWDYRPPQYGNPSWV